MGIREIRLLGDPVLRSEAAPVTEFDDALLALVKDMWATMYAAEGIGLAAPQVGVAERVLVVDVQRSDEGGPDPVALVNPVIVWASSETDKATEGCLSIPGLEEFVTRPERVRIEARSPEGSPVAIETGGLFARALQHEIDHLDGVLFLDRVSALKRRMLLKKWKKAQAESEVRSG